MCKFQCLKSFKSNISDQQWQAWLKYAREEKKKRSSSSKPNIVRKESDGLSTLSKSEWNDSIVTDSPDEKKCSAQSRRHQSPTTHGRTDQIYAQGHTPRRKNAKIPEIFPIEVSLQPPKTLRRGHQHSMDSNPQSERPNLVRSETFSSTSPKKHFEKFHWEEDESTTTRCSSFSGSKSFKPSSAKKPREHSTRSLSCKKKDDFVFVDESEIARGHSKIKRPGENINAAK